MRSLSATPSFDLDRFFGGSSVNTNEHKARALELGLEWAAVLVAYRDARRLEADEVERIGTFRRDTLQQLTGDHHGGRFKSRHRAAFNGGDATYIRGIDVTAAGRGMSADELYDQLAAAAPTMRPADEVMSEVIDRLAEQAGPAEESEPTWVGLVAAAAAADITEQWLRQLAKAGKVRRRKVGRCWQVAAEDLAFFQRHPTAGRPRLRAHLDAAPF